MLAPRPYPRRRRRCPGGGGHNAAAQQRSSRAYPPPASSGALAPAITAELICPGDRKAGPAATDSCWAIDGEEERGRREGAALAVAGMSMTRAAAAARPPAAVLLCAAAAAAAATTAAKPPPAQVQPSSSPRFSGRNSASGMPLPKAEEVVMPPQDQSLKPTFPSYFSVAASSSAPSERHGRSRPRKGPRTSRCRSRPPLKSG